MNKDDKEAWKKHINFTLNKFPYAIVGNDDLKKAIEMHEVLCFMGGRESLKQELADYKEALKNIAKYETCWKCEYYQGLNDSYCNPPGNCNISTRNQFKPTERTKKVARQVLDKYKQEGRDE